MIAGLHGKIVRFGASRIQLDAGGVEYEVQLPLDVFESLQKNAQDSVHLFIYHQFLTDGEQKLFGFLDPGSREFFIALQTIKGIGTSLALSILSHLRAGDLLAICERNDIESLCRIPRIGKTTAETIIFEIKRRRDKWSKLFLGDEPGRQPEAMPEELALQALTAQLGYKENQVKAAFEKLKVMAGPRPGNAADWIKEVLKHL